ncbi:MAG: hypothetical protein EOO41_02030 [Methanobacteriota archaeon]|nr:MAG: hypothetical protein EOO41_02030 [Euryarchaeota archaeon]
MTTRRSQVLSLVLLLAGARVACGEAAPAPRASANDDAAAVQRAQLIAASMQYMLQGVPHAINGCGAERVYLLGGGCAVAEQMAALRALAQDDGAAPLFSPAWATRSDEAHPHEVNVCATADMLCCWQPSVRLPRRAEHAAQAEAADEHGSSHCVTDARGCAAAHVGVALAAVRTPSDLSALLEEVLNARMTHLVVALPCMEQPLTAAIAQVFPSAPRVPACHPDLSTDLQLVHVVEARTGMLLDMSATARLRQHAFANMSVVGAAHWLAHTSLVFVHPGTLSSAATFRWLNATLDMDLAQLKWFKSALDLLTPLQQRDGAAWTSSSAGDRLTAARAVGHAVQSYLDARGRAYVSLVTHMHVVAQHMRDMLSSLIVSTHGLAVRHPPVTRARATRSALHDVTTTCATVAKSAIALHSENNTDSGGGESRGAPNKDAYAHELHACVWAQNFITTESMACVLEPWLPPLHVAPDAPPPQDNAARVVHIDEGDESAQQAGAWRSMDSDSLDASTLLDSMVVPDGPGAAHLHTATRMLLSSQPSGEQAGATQTGAAQADDMVVHIVGGLPALMNETSLTTARKQQIRQMFMFSTATLNDAASASVGLPAIVQLAASAWMLHATAHCIKASEALERLYADAHAVYVSAHTFVHTRARRPFTAHYHSPPAQLHARTHAFADAPTRSYKRCCP